MENFDIYKLLEMLVPMILLVLSSFFGVKFISLRNKVNDVVALIGKVNAALADNQLSQDEMKSIVADVLKILGKEPPK